ncbi:uncharacterized protein LOC124137400 [Haliotis rufescens]|uniref:uncharacterized protein LOC124137400 n=1 Tax=Haliotis rufescens TaxID=6454 RepID=UPI00201EA919|nr:uncharacterized protein LOC124137400 [Haliotis rufescens]
MNAPSVVDILAPITEFGWKMYLQTTDEKDRIKHDDADIAVLLDEVVCTTAPMEYDPQVQPSAKSTQLVFNSVYDNRTKHDHQHRFVTQKETVATATVEMTEGFTSGSDVGFTINTPPQVAKATSGFGREVVIKSVTTHTVEKSLSWAVDAQVLAPSKSRTIAKLEVMEHTFESEFKAYVTLVGKVKVRISRSCDGKFLKMIQNPIGTILGDRLPKFKVKVNESWNQDGIKTKDKSARFCVKGRVTFNYGVSQNVDVSQTKLPQSPAE